MRLTAKVKPRCSLNTSGGGGGNNKLETTQNYLPSYVKNTTKTQPSFILSSSIFKSLQTYTETEGTM